MRIGIGIVLAMIAATVGSLIAFVLTRETWMIASAFGIGASDRREARVRLRSER